MYQNRITFQEATDLDVLMAADKYNIVDLVANMRKIRPHELVRE
jgi:hypothetical protein